MYQHGCVGGAVGLSLANKLVKATGEPSAVVSLELCSLIHQGEDLSRGSLVGSAIFGDGAGCAVITPEPVSGVSAIQILGASSYLIPGTEQLIGYQILDDGTHLKLDKEVVLNLINHVPGAVQIFLETQGLESTDIDAWLLHPGSAKIVESLEQGLGLRPEATRWTWEVLTRQGNMSSASVFFVLAEYLKDREREQGPRGKGGKALMLGVGPGISLELVLLG
jgi:alkylresorcinol/alkylpyrone synthase